VIQINRAYLYKNSESFRQFESSAIQRISEEDVQWNFKSFELESYDIQKLKEYALSVLFIDLGSHTFEHVLEIKKQCAGLTIVLLCDQEQFDTPEFDKLKGFVTDFDCKPLSRFTLGNRLIKVQQALNQNEELRSAKLRLVELKEQFENKIEEIKLTKAENEVL
jgi:hypothetical protein